MSESSSLFFDIFGRDKGVGKMLDDVSGKAEGMGGKFKAVGMAMGAGLLAVGAAVAHSGLEKLKEDQVATAQLEAGIKSTGNAANLTIPGMVDLAASIQEYSGQTQGSIEGAESLIQTFTNIKNVGADKIFDDTTKAAADMAAKLGGDASTQAMLLGKALQDPATGLTRLMRAGVSFTAAQKEQIKAMQASGDILGAQKIILGEVSKEFGGAAEAAGNTLPGEMAKAKNAFADVSASLMTALMPALTGIAKTMTGVAKWATQNQPLVMGLAAAVGILALGFIILNVATAIAAAPFIAIGIGIAALIAGLVLAYNNIGWFKDGVNTAISVVGAVIGWLYNSIIQPTFAVIVAVITGVVNFISGVVVPGFQNAFNWIGDAITNAVTFFNQFRDGVSNAIGDAIKFVQNIPGKVTDALSGATTWLVQTGEDIINGLSTGITNVIGGVKDTITKGLGDAVQGVKDFLGIHSPSRVFAEIGGNIGLGLMEGVKSTGNMVGDAVNSLTTNTLGDTTTTSRAASVGRQLSAAAMGTGSNSQMTMTGTLVMDSGEVLGIFHGIATKAADTAINSANDYLGRRPSR